MSMNSRYFARLAPSGSSVSSPRTAGAYTSTRRLAGQRMFGRLTRATGLSLCSQRAASIASSRHAR